MERRLVMYQLKTTDLTNKDMEGKLQQDLGYACFRRVQSKTGKSVFYLNYQREMDTYQALRVAKGMKTISVVRYRHRNPTLPPPKNLYEFPPEEITFRPFHPKSLSDITRYAFSNHIEQFASKVFYRICSYMRPNSFYTGIFPTIYPSGFRSNM